MFTRVLASAALVLAVPAAALPSRTAAQGGAASVLALAWTAPAECPSGADVEREVTRLLGASAEHAGDALEVDARVERSEERLRLELTTHTAEGDARRELEGESCEALADAAALVIAMAIDPDAVARTEDEAASARAPTELMPEDGRPVHPVSHEPGAVGLGEPSAAPRGAGEVEIHEEDQEHAEPSPGAHFVLAAGAILGVGQLPSVSGGAWLAVGARVDVLEVTLGASFLAPTRVVQVADPRERGADIGLASGRLRACVLFDVSPLELGGCAALDVGAMWGSGFGVDRPTRATTPWVSGQLGAEGRVHLLEELAITLSLELGVPFLAPDFVLARMPVHVPAEANFTGALGVLLRL